MTPIDVIAKSVGRELIFSPSKCKFIGHKCTNIARQYAVSFSKCESATSELKASMKTPCMKRKLSQFSPKSSHVTPKRKKRITSTAVHKSMYVAQSTPMSSLPQSASVLVSKRRYGSAFRVLTSKNKSAHNSFRYCVKDAVRKEVISLCKQEHSSLAAQADMSTLTNFKWKNVASEVSKQCPILWSALLASTTTRSTERNVTNKCGKNLLPTLSTIIGMLSYCRNPKKMKVIQQLIGVQMWLGGVKREVGTRLNVISLCQGLASTMKTIDNLIKDSSKIVWVEARCDKLPSKAILSQTSICRRSRMDWWRWHINSTVLQHCFWQCKSKDQCSTSILCSTQQNAQYGAGICRTGQD